MGQQDSAAQPPYAPPGQTVPEVVVTLVPVAAMTLLGDGLSPTVGPHLVQPTGEPAR